jgi:hypothetical protein
VLPSGITYSLPLSVPRIKVQSKKVSLRLKKEFCGVLKEKCCAKYFDLTSREQTEV